MLVITSSTYLGGLFKVRFEGGLKMVLQDDNVRVCDSIHLINLLQTLLAVFNTLLYVNAPRAGEGNKSRFTNRELN